MKINELINLDRMKLFLNSPMEWFHQFGDVYNTPDGILIYKDNGADILSVAHLDSVNDLYHFHVVNIGGDDMILSTHMDDRLGAYLILEVLPQLGVHADILLTEGEEKGKSTAKHVKTDKEYNWMFSFDRRGVDAVHYRYNMTKWTAALRTIWKDVSHGSNSDIDYLHELGCCGVNVGTGYHLEHDIMAYANLNEIGLQLERFMQFYSENKDIFYEYTAPAWKPANNYYTGAYTYTPPAVPAAPVNINREREIVIYIGDEEDIDPDYNPYAAMTVDLPLDMHEYIDNSGVTNAPKQCAFCLEDITPASLHVFMGICSECEQFAVCCVVCNSYYCRADFPSEDMGQELFFGICPTCEEQERFKYAKDNRLSSPDDGRKQADANSAGDEGNPQT